MDTFTTTHKILAADARDLSLLPDASVDLIITSPPYPMIAMWDDLFSHLSPGAADALSRQDGMLAFEFMHLELDKVWKELSRVLKSGSFACINIGDATRSIGNIFRLYPNHSRITSSFAALGFDPLPMIHWKKTTNAPTKFMGSGMLPAGAYVTLEHEYVLVFRKAGKRDFTSDTERQRRRESALFWEERNVWFSDTWELSGARQMLDSGTQRSRSAAFPFELPWRCINMFSLYGDIVLDPFSGTGTTTCAAIASGRSSVALEIDTVLAEAIMREAISSVNYSEIINSRRIAHHLDFVNKRASEHNALTHNISRYQIPVMTSQESGMVFRTPSKIDTSQSGQLVITYDHTDIPLILLPKDKP